jgi:hypothetical protein
MLKQVETRINSRDQFESCYMRHQYLRRVQKHPTREEMAPYYKIVESFTRNTFYVYKNLFLMVGLDLEDVFNNGQIQLISFLGLFALECTPQKLADFERSFTNRNSIVCSKQDILNKNKSSFTCFLKQRLDDMVRVCKQKAKNIKGLVAEEYVVFKGTKLPPRDMEDLLENHEKYGFRPMTTTAFKAIKNKMSVNQDGPYYFNDGVWYVCVPVRKKVLGLVDFACNNYDPYDNLHNMTPEQVFDRLEGLDWEGKLLKFNAVSNNERMDIIKDFISKNKNNPTFKEELKTAKKYLERICVTTDI